GGREAVLHRVADLDRLVERAHRDHRHHRPEHLLAGDAHRGRAVAEDRRLVEVAVRPRAALQAVAPREQPRTLVPGDLHVVLDRAALALADAGAHLDARVRPVADAQGLGALHELRGELLVDLLVDGDAAGRRAPLPGRAEAAPDGAVDGEVEPGVVH